MLVEHAQAALKGAEAAQKEKAHDKRAAAIAKLKEAVEAGKGGKVDVATKSAESALALLKEVK